MARTTNKELKLWNEFGSKYLAANMQASEHFRTKSLVWRQKLIIRLLKKEGYSLNKKP